MALVGPGRCVVGLFNRAKSASASSGSTLQIPDQFAERARGAYGNSDFVRAAELYGDAIDKLHTMYVMASPPCALRRPSQSDASITEGIVSAVGAALAMDSRAPVQNVAERSIGYLNEIIALPQATPMANLYETAIRGLDAELRRSR